MKLENSELSQTKQARSHKQHKIDGVVIGLLLSINDQGQPLIVYPGNPQETAIPARSTAQLESQDIGCEIALLFEGGDPKQPLIIGKIQQSQAKQTVEQDQQPDIAELDGESIVLSARQNITLKCGKASITLTKAGKVLIRGAYLLNRSSGVNQIKGGSVHIN